MYDNFESQLNDLLVDIFQGVLTVEEQMLKNTKFDLSITELHTLEAVGNCSAAAGDASSNANGDATAGGTVSGCTLSGCTVSALAQALDVTLPTVTVCIKRLEKKGYVRKARSETDGRAVRIFLTEKGRKVDAAHRYFHRRMVRSFLKEVGEEERPVLLKALENLDGFLDRQIQRQSDEEKAVVL